MRKPYRGEHKNGNIKFEFLEQNSALVDFCMDTFNRNLIQRKNWAFITDY